MVFLSKSSLPSSRIELDASHTFFYVREWWGHVTEMIFLTRTFHGLMHPAIPIVWSALRSPVASLPRDTLGVRFRHTSLTTHHLNAMQGDQRGPKPVFNILLISTSMKFMWACHQCSGINLVQLAVPRVRSF